jgi:undecaprenyl-diphosphatase
MNAFDAGILSFLNQFANQWPAFDQAVTYVAMHNAFKGGVLVALIWLLWARDAGKTCETRQRLVCTYLSCLAAIAIARGLSWLLPFRTRPIHDEELGFVPTYGMHAASQVDWSAMPSDHAVLFYALSVGILMASQKAGLFALVYTTVVIAAPRVYLGLHYPTDIIVGATVGGTIAWCGVAHVFNERVSPKLIEYSRKRPWLFYAGFVFVSLEIVSLFEGVRGLGRVAWAMVVGGNA